MFGSLRCVRTGRSYDDIGDSCRMSKDSVRRYANTFRKRLINVYGKDYLNRRPTRKEMGAIEKQYRKNLFSGCMGSVYCCNPKWKKSPNNLKGQVFNPKDAKVALKSFEVSCDRNLYVWNWFGGRPGTNKDPTLMENFVYQMIY